MGEYLVRITEDAEFDSYANLDDAATKIVGAIGCSVFGDDDETRFLTLLVRADDLDALKGPLMITLPEGGPSAGRNRATDPEQGPDEADRWEMAQAEWEQAWVRESPFLADRNLHARYEAAGRMLTEVVLYDGRLGRSGAGG